MQQERGEAVHGGKRARAEVRAARNGGIEVRVKAARARLARAWSLYNERNVQAQTKFFPRGRCCCRTRPVRARVMHSTVEGG